MQISFANNKIRKACSDFLSMRKEYGERRAKALTARMQQLQEADNLGELYAASGDWHELTQNRYGQLSGNLGHPYRLIIEPDHVPVPQKPDGGLDWTLVSAVTIIEVVDYH